MQFMSMLHDLLLSGANLSAKTIAYVLRHAEKLGEPIGNFPLEHPIFRYIAASPNITHRFALDVIRLSQGNHAVREALTHNDVLSESERVLFALS